HAASLRPKDYALQLGLGELYYQLGEADLARQAFDTAVKLGERHSDPHTWIGILAYEAGDLREAIGPLEKAVQYDPANALAGFYLAQVSLQLNDPLRADFQLAMVRRLQPTADLARFEPGRPALAAGVTTRLETHRWRAP